MVNLLRANRDYSGSWFEVTRAELFSITSIARGAGPSSPRVGLVVSDAGEIAGSTTATGRS